MKFCDKLQKIRKENNITQEQLADKLGVSRQAVSKWESGTAYPDTEKLIQISKLFNVSLDELINDNADTNKNSSSKKKFNFMETFDMVFESVRKVFSMFFVMKFWEKVKFLIEMALVVLAIYLAAALVNGIILSIIRRIFAFLPYKAVDVIDYIFYTLLYVAWIIIGVMFFIRVLKVRYLDYYVIVKDDTIDTPVIEEPIKELKEKKETKIVIRDPKDSSASFFKTIGKILLFLFKCFCLLILTPIVIMFVTFVVLLVISLAFIFSGLFFNGITLGILGVLLFSYLLIRFIYNVIFNQKINYGKLFIIFIASITLMGIGIGLSFTSLSSFTTYSERVWDSAKTTLTVNMSDDIVFFDIDDIDDDKIVFDDGLDVIKLDVVTNENVTPYVHYERVYNYSDEDELHEYQFVTIDIDGNDLATFKQRIDDLKHKKFNTYDSYNSDYEIEKLYISHDNLSIIKANNHKFDD